jgi:hypothetical protein
MWVEEDRMEEGEVSELMTTCGPIRRQQRSSVAAQQSTHRPPPTTHLPANLDVHVVADAQHHCFVSPPPHEDVAADLDPPEQLQSPAMGGSEGGDSE